MRLLAATCGLAMATALAACGDGSFAPGEEVWVELDGDVAVNRGYALAIVIEQRKELVEIQVNRLEGGTGNEYLTVLKSGRGFVPARIVRPRSRGLADASRRRETVATYRDVLADNLARPVRVSGKAARRARDYGMREIDLAFDLQTIFFRGTVGADDAIDLSAARRNAGEVIRAIRARLDLATRGMSDDDAMRAAAAAAALPAAGRAADPQAPIGHGLRLARRTFTLALTARDVMTPTTVSLARDLRAAVDAYGAFAWRYDRRIREAARRFAVTDLSVATARLRELYFKEMVARLRDQVLGHVALGLEPPLAPATIDAKFAEARAATAEISKALGVELIPAGARDRFAAVLDATVRRLSDAARLDYIRGNAHGIVLAGRWSGSALCLPDDPDALLPFAAELRLDLDLASEGLGVFRGTVAAHATPAPGQHVSVLLRRVLPGGSLPGEGTTRGTVRIRVDTETGEVRWLRIMHWQAGPPTLQHQLAAATGRLEWHRPVRFSIRVCGRWIDMKRGDASAHTR